MHRTRNADHAGAAPAGGSSSPVDQTAERPILTREVDGANPSGAATFLEVKAGRSYNRSLWSMTTDFRAGRKHCSDAAVS